MTDEERPDELDDLLDRGISVAFGESAQASQSGWVAAPERAVLETLDDLPRDLDRYEVRSVLGAGGMGTVAGGHDLELDRPVAIKFVRRALSSDPALKGLFEAEARITAQLQHPGIVPVYDFGTTDDGRLYTVMQQVEGESLHSRLLSRRVEIAEGSADPGELLQAFAKICETVAFAHSREVVHGDLKPANVMLGAFGEVLVLDWGFARSLSDEGGAKGTEPRRWLGTPAYMAPEQASSTETRDCRTDVFCLGGILCEILTGAPPYIGATREDVRLRAKRAWLDETHERLGRCDADPALVVLVQQCLAEDPDARPTNAGVLEVAVRDHLAATERRARESAMDAAAQRARAEEELRARRLTRALAGVVVLVLVVAGAAWGWWIQHDARLRSEAVQRVGEAQERSDALRDRARAATEGEVALWREATTAARAAVALAESSSVDDGLMRSVRAAAEAVETEAFVSVRDSYVAHLIDEIRPHAVENRPMRHLDDEHGALLALFGLDLSEDSIDEAAEVIKASPLAPQVAEELHRWSNHRRRRMRPDGDPDAWRSLLDLADRVDPDPWRTKLRDASRRHDTEELRALAKPLEENAESTEGLAILAECLRAAGDDDEALRLYWLAYSRDPGDYGVVHDLAALLEGVHEEGESRDQITRLFTAALALRPDSAHANVDMAVALRKEGEPKLARTFTDRAIEIDPKDRRAWQLIQNLAVDAGDLREAVRAARVLLEIEPRFLPHLTSLASMLTYLGEIDEAREIAERAVRVAPGRARAHSALSSVEIRSGNLEAAIRSARRAVELDESRASCWFALAIALDHARIDEEAVAAYRRTLATGQSSGETHCSLGNVLLRMGRVDEAVEQLRIGHEKGKRVALWKYPSARWLQRAEKIRALMPAVARVARGEAPPPNDVAELGAFSAAAIASGNDSLGLELFERAINSGYPIGEGLLDVVGACVRAEHALLEAVAVTPAERARAEGLGIELLRGMMRYLQTAPQKPEQYSEARKVVDSWLLSPLLAKVRGDEESGLPEAAKQRWSSVFEDVRRLRAELDGKK